MSHADRDRELLDRLEVHLQPLVPKKITQIWHTGKLLAGENKAERIDAELAAADVILLLISADFLRHQDHIMERALQRRETNAAAVIPVILASCEWRSTALRPLEVLPRWGQPVRQWSDREEALADVAKGVAKVLDRRRRPTPAFSEDRVDIGRLPNPDTEVLGRKGELERLDKAWHAEDQRIISLVAWGGVGKSSLVRHWLEQISSRNYHGADRVFGWSFYRQGAGDTEASAEAFTEEALRFFGDPVATDDPKKIYPLDRSLRLARLIGRGQHLLILDGLEPLQYPPGPEEGRLKDPGLKALLKQLAAVNPGLCVITTRIQIPDLGFLPESTIPLGNLSPEAGARLLESLGVTGPVPLLKRASEELSGHALTLKLLGTYLKGRFGGDVRCRDRVPAPKANEPHGTQARKVMARYEQWLAGQPELALLRLAGLFDRPALSKELEELLKEPAIDGLTETLRAVLDQNEEWQDLIWKLNRIQLLMDRSISDAEVLDVHPLVRMYFGDRLRSQNPEAWRKGHRRLYELHKRAAPARRDPDEKLQAEDYRRLLLATIHGCRAGRYREALEEVYYSKIIEGERSFHERPYPVPSSLLTAISEFFEGTSWLSPAADLSDKQKAFVREEVGHCLFLVGRLGEAIRPLKESINLRRESGAKNRASKHARLLREVHLTLGELKAAGRSAEESLELLGKEGKPSLLFRQKAGLGQVLHWMGDLEGADEVFLEAERINRKQDGYNSILYSYYGFWYCELLLDRGEARAIRRPSESVSSAASQRESNGIQLGARSLFQEARERAGQTIEIARKHDWLIDTALDQLTIGRSLVLESISCGAADLDEASRRLDRAVKDLQKSGEKHYLVRGLLARAELRWHLGKVSEAALDLDQALDLATGCKMRPFEVDCLLGRCRLQLDDDSLDEAEDSLGKAVELIGDTHYRRREPLAAYLRERLDSLRGSR